MSTSNIALARMLAFIIIQFGAFSVAASSATLDDALKQYYAGFPQTAVEMLEPVARAGDTRAQYMLGNMLYSLSTDRGGESLEDSINWYRMAADQGSAEANYALGVIYENSWGNSDLEAELAYAMVYYGEAADLGVNEAQMRLRRLAKRSGLSRDDALGLYRLSEAQAPKTAQREPDEVQAIKVVETDQANEAVVGPEIVVAEVAEVEQPIAIVQAEQPVAAIESSEVEQPVTVAEAEPVVESQSEAAPVGPPVTLDELFHQCQNLTETGFAIFADSIRDSQFTGTARMIDVKSESFDSDNYTARLASTQSGNTLFVSLEGVPREVADGFQRGTRYQINGTILESKLSGSRCNLNLQYPSVSG